MKCLNCQTKIVPTTWQMFSLQGYECKACHKSYFPSTNWGLIYLILPLVSSTVINTIFFKILGLDIGLARDQKILLVWPQFDPLFLKFFALVVVALLFGILNYFFLFFIFGTCSIEANRDPKKVNFLALIFTWCCVYFVLQAFTYRIWIL